MSAQLSRRRLLVATAAAGFLAACHSGRTAAAPSDGGDDYAALEGKHHAKIGIYAVDLASSATVEHRADERFSLCSTFKAYAAARVLQLVDNGQADLAAQVPVTSDDIVEYSPVTSQAVGSSMPLRDICAAALQHSDNTAGNLLLRTIGGPAAITAFARSVGDTQSRLDRWETALNSAEPHDPRDTTTPRALCGGYRQILTGDALSSESRTELQHWMTANVTSAKRFRAGIPSGWTSADKTGAGDYGSTNDAGLLIGPTGERIVAVVLVRSLTDVRDSPTFDDAVAEAVRLALKRFGHLSG